jgi:transcription elongation GreA/GreB family factor
LGRALIGHAKGAEVEYEAANRKLKAKIMDILPGDF